MSGFLVLILKEEEYACAAEQIELREFREQPRIRSVAAAARPSQTQPSANRAAAVLRMTAMSLGRTQTALGAFYRRLAARIR